MQLESENWQTAGAYRDGPLHVFSDGVARFLTNGSLEIDTTFHTTQPLGTQTPSDADQLG